MLNTIPKELLLFLNFYSANLNFRLQDSYLEANILLEQAEICYASRLKYNTTVSNTLKKFSNTLDDKWPLELENKKKYLTRLYVAQLNSNTIDEFKFAEYLAIENVKQIFSMVLGISYKITTLQDALNASKYYKNSRNFSVALNAYTGVYRVYVGSISDSTISVANTALCASLLTTNTTIKSLIFRTSIQIAIDALKTFKNTKCKYLYLYE